MSSTLLTSALFGAHMTIFLEIISERKWFTKFDVEQFFRLIFLICR